MRRNRRRKRRSGSKALITVLLILVAVSAVSLIKSVNENNYDGTGNYRVNEYNENNYKEENVDTWTFAILKKIITGVTGCFDGIKDRITGEGTNGNNNAGVLNAGGSEAEGSNSENTDYSGSGAGISGERGDGVISSAINGKREENDVISSYVYDDSLQTAGLSDEALTTGNQKEKNDAGIWKLLLCGAVSGGSDSLYREGDNYGTDENCDIVKIVDNITGVNNEESVSDAMNGNKDVSGETSPPPEGSVLIYHTHSSESYEPYSEGNYHITGDSGTVRNVGNQMQAVLESKGITVYHDLTLHDSPSYRNSYGRSLATAESWLSQHPDIKVVIDLHRDALAQGGSKYKTITVNGKAATSFNIVVGNQNPNFSQLMNFAEKVLAKSNEMYPGLGGRVIEREYKFNEYLSNNYMLVEIGNNGNTIDEAEMTGRLLGEVICAVMREL